MLFFVLAVGLWCAAFVGGGMLLWWKRPSPVTLLALVGLALALAGAWDAWEIAYGWRANPARGLDRLGAAAWWLLFAVPWLLVGRRHVEEDRALATGDRVGEGTWRFQVNGVELEVVRRTSGPRRRFTDRRGHAVLARLPLGDARIERGARKEWRYEGPPHVRAVWLAGEVPARLGPLVRGGAAVSDGQLQVPLSAWLDERRLATELAAAAAVVEAVRASGQGAAVRVQAEARDRSDHLRRVDAWRTLADHLPAGLPGIAPEGLADPDPVIRAIAGRALADHDVIASVLATVDDSDAVRRAAEAALEHGWTDLADTTAARIGGFAEGAWFTLVKVLAVLGGPAHVPRLREIADDPGYPRALREEARVATARILERVGPEAGGRVSLVSAGGELSLA